jgi:hypothetical protein
MDPETPAYAGVSKFRVTIPDVANFNSTILELKARSPKGYS